MIQNKNNLNNFFIISFTLLILVSVVVFEAAQQLYYIRRFQLSDDIYFTPLLLGHTRKWIIWTIYAIPLWFYLKRLAQIEWITIKHIAQSIALITLLLFMVLLTMCAVEIPLGGNPIGSLRMWQEFMVFYAFQKTPIYTFGYIFLSLVFYLYLKNNELIIQVLKLNQLNRDDLNLFFKNKMNQDQNTAVLKIKVGNKYKIISIEDIDWIEADDYCVNIHSRTSDTVYSMRATLKYLESVLPASFLRVHRSAIVNMEGVEEYKTQGSGLITMKSGDEIAVAQSKLKMINDFFKQESG